MSQEILERAMELRQASEEAEQQLAFVTQQIAELEDFEKGLEAVEKSSEEGIMAPLGRGVFMKAKKDADDKLLVDVGADVLIKKTPAETREVIVGQIKKFHEAKVQLGHQLEQYAAEFREMLAKIEELKKG